MDTFIRDLPRRWKSAFYLSLDLILVPTSLFLALIVLTQTPWYSAALNSTWPFFALLTILGGAMLIGLGIPGIKLIAYDTNAILKTGLSALAMTVFGAAISALTRPEIPLGLFIMFGFLFFGLSVAMRLIGLQILLVIYRRGEHRTRVLIYGAGATGVQLAAALTQSEEIEPVVFVDDNKTLQGMTVAGLRVFPPTQLADLVRDMGIDQVVLAMPSQSPPRQALIVERLEKIGIDIHKVPSFSELIGNHSLVERLEPVRPTDFLGRTRLDAELPGIADNYAGKTILISGAGGSVGGELCRQLLGSNPATLILLDHSEPALYTINQELLTLAGATGVQIVPLIGSTGDQGLVRRILQMHDIDVILHAAAHKHVPLVEENEVEGLRNNILGTRILAEAARAAGVRHFVLISSDKAVRPANVMGASKRLAELVIQDLAVRSETTLFSMVRFGNVLGSSGSVIPLFQEQIARGGPITLTDRDVTRYFMTLSEATRLVLLAGTYARGGDVFVLDMGAPVQIRKLARQMIRRAGFTVRNADNPDGDIEITITGLRPGEKLYEELLIGTDMRITPHPKILRAQEEMLSEIEVATMLKDLGTVVATADSAAARALIGRWVAGYQRPKRPERSRQR